MERVSLFYSVNLIEYWRICELTIWYSDIVISQVILTGAMNIKTEIFISANAFSVLVLC